MFFHLVLLLVMYYDIYLPLLVFFYVTSIREWKMEREIRSDSDWFIILLLRATQIQNEREATNSFFVHCFNLDPRISPLVALQKRI